jgi:hypothetical protein
MAARSRPLGSLGRSAEGFVTVGIKLSDRASRYIAEWQRVPHVSTLQQVREALVRAGAPVAQAFLDFHETFAGCVFDCVLEVGVLGLAHPEPAWLVPNEVEAWEPEPPNQLLWKVRIADVNPTFWWVIDEDGTYYTAAGVRIAGSFARYVEQQALWTEFTADRCCWTGNLAVNNPAGRLADEFLPRLRSHLVPELSDVHSQVYTTADMVVWVVRDSGCVDIAVRVGTAPRELTGVAWGDSA